MSPGVWRRWLPAWLPENFLASLMFDHSNVSLGASVATSVKSRSATLAAASDNGKGINDAVAAGAIICQAAPYNGAAAHYFPNPQWVGSPPRGPVQPNWDLLAEMGNPAAREEESW